MGGGVHFITFLNGATFIWGVILQSSEKPEGLLAMCFCGFQSMSSWLVSIDMVHPGVAFETQYSM